MANPSNLRYSNIARPYALAAFEYAREKNQLKEWKTFLETAAFTAQQPGMASLFSNPAIQPSQLFSLFDEVLSPQMDEERRNFLQLIEQYNRFMVLPDIAVLFTAYQDALEKVSAVHLVTAVEASDDFKQKLSQALTKRTGNQITLQSEVDATIIGGAIVRIGDEVIDGSVRGKLARLLENSLR